MDEKQQWPRVPPTRRALKPARRSRRTAAQSPPPQSPAPRGPRGAEDPRQSSPSEFGGGRRADCLWSLSERWPNAGQDCAHPDAVLGRGC